MEVRGQQAHQDGDDHDRTDHHREHVARDERDHRDPERGAREASEQQEPVAPPVDVGALGDRHGHDHREAREHHRARQRRRHHQRDDRDREQVAAEPDDALHRRGQRDGRRDDEPVRHRDVHGERSSAPW